MPQQNRVTPFGTIIATPERGTFLGNRGVLHDEDRRIRRAWQVKRWIICVLEFRGRKRSILTPGRYTELFFLDEATALAAGHRPCAECRRACYTAFRDAWEQAHPNSEKSAPITANEMDASLHAERMAPDRSRRTFPAMLDDLPDGVFVTMPTWNAEAFLVQGDSLMAWSPGGYREHRPRPRGEEVRVLTPASTVNVIRAGYVPSLHPSASTAGKTGGS